MVAKAMQFRARVSAAPLKPNATKRKWSKDGKFRARVSAAPLKRRFAILGLANSGKIPRSRERGSIEARAPRIWNQGRATTLEPTGSTIVCARGYLKVWVGMTNLFSDWRRIDDRAMQMESNVVARHRLCKKLKISDGKYHFTCAFVEQVRTHHRQPFCLRHHFIQRRHHSFALLYPREYLLFSSDGRPLVYLQCSPLQFEIGNLLPISELNGEGI